MRVALVYDCLYPHTIGGAERWLRALALGAVDAGHDVTYLTRHQWGDGEPDLPGAEVVAVSGASALYGPSGERLVGPGVRFGRGVARHLAAHRRAYDLVHVANFPYFGVLGARAALAGSGVPLLVEWHEVLSAGYLRGFLGGPRGRAALGVQAACVRAGTRSLCFSEMTEERLRAAGARDVLRLPGLFPSGDAAPSPAPERPHVVYAGRHVADKRVLLVPDVVAALRPLLPGLHATVLGDGPLHAALRARVAELGLADVVSLPGAVVPEEVPRVLASASCLLLPSMREGYGLVVVEAAAYGTPSVVVAGPDNAAVDLVEAGVNGAVVASPAPNDVAGAVAAVVRAGEPLRESTAAWYAAESPRRSVAASVAAVLDLYARL
ncbi:MAG TPA: glycosyltransferase family 4 protein [Frankiaceae bacterium]|jgi:glycosyltransferase involved in cell wall biosynthesis|nr:glycosyltransferase family 4 protein [Frankiaceae bacterium]